MGDAGKIPLLGRGNISASVPMLGGYTQVGTFTDVQFAPDLIINPLSLAAMMAKGLSVTFKGRECIIRNQQNKVIGRDDPSDKTSYIS